jgi:hypothetical protein
MEAEAGKQAVWQRLAGGRQLERVRQRHASSGREQAEARKQAGSRGI